MPYGIFVYGLASGGEEINAWLFSFDVDAHDGMGAAQFTQYKHRAYQFPSMAAATFAWRQQSKVRPLRDDGKPNRPLTAFTIEIRRL